MVGWCWLKAVVSVGSACSEGQTEFKSADASAGDSAEVDLLTAAVW